MLRCKQYVFWINLQATRTKFQEKYVGKHRKS